MARDKVAPCKLSLRQAVEFVAFNVTFVSFRADARRPEKIRRRLQNRYPKLSLSPRAFLPPIRSLSPSTGSFPVSSPHILA